MLTDEKEIEIISSAIQKNVRSPKRAREPFLRIFEDFFGDRLHQDGTYLDLGPGHFDFGELVKPHGPRNTWGIDFDPAVIELGKHKGYPVVEKDLKHLKAEDFPQPFDGVFCKYSIDAFFYREADEDALHRQFIHELAKCIKPGGWAWIAPWNGACQGLSNKRIREVLKLQAESFYDHGFWGVELSDELSKFYGIHGKTANRALFCLNLPKPERLAKCSEVRTRLEEDHWFYGLKQTGHRLMATVSGTSNQGERP